MNSGTGWTKRNKPKSQDLSIESHLSIAALSKPHRSAHHGFAWTLALVVILGGAGCAFWVLTGYTTAQAMVASSGSTASVADASFGLLQKRLAQEASYRSYATKVSDGIIASGQADLAGAPILDRWAHNDPSRLDSIVNKQHPIHPLDFTPQLVSVACGNGGDAQIVPAAKDDFTALCQAALQAGAPLEVTSSYRSYQSQLATYNWWIAYAGQTRADDSSARPGYSEHQLGLSIDFAAPGGLGLESFTGTSQQQWLSAHAAEYGFVQRYTPQNESVTGYHPEVWHYRYLGREVAAAYVKSGALSLEQYWHVSGGTYDKSVYSTMPADSK